MALEASIEVSVLRELFRNLQAFRAIYESEGVDTLISEDGSEWCLWDVEYLYEQIGVLPRRQRQAIHFLVLNVKESDAAVVMGIAPTNPVGMYATEGLKKLIGMIDQGAFPRFRMARETA